ncbi:hypothetical protein ACFX12_030258 [Malus domestica]
MAKCTEKTMYAKELTYRDAVKYTVLEVKPTQGIGIRIDAVLVNGMLHKGDQIVVCNMHDLSFNSSLDDTKIDE